MKNFRDIMLRNGYAAFVPAAELPADLFATAQELRDGEEDDFLITVSKERGRKFVGLTPARSLLHLMVCAGGPAHVNWGTMPHIVTF